MHIGKSLKKSRRHLIHPFVGTLGGEHYRHQELIRIGIMQLGLGIGQMFFKIADQKGRFFFRFHALQKYGTAKLIG